MITGLIARLRSLWRGIGRRDAVEAEMTEEFLLHMELRAKDLEKTGVPVAAALAQARREFGVTEYHRDDARRSRGLHRVDAIRFSLLDFRLGARMMAKYPGLTLISGIGMAVGIAIATGYGSVMSVLMESSLPLPGGDRIVALQNWDTKFNRRGQARAHDFVAWRDGVKGVRDIGAYRNVTRNLVGADGSAEALTIAEMSASGFRVAGTPAALGRYLLDADELPGAPPVVVIAHDIWQRRFTGDSSIVGRELRFGTRIHTVVGVMPEGFAFPVNHHVWMPLSVDLAARAGEGATLSAFGRLADGVTLQTARAEIALLGSRAAAEFPLTHKDLEAQVQHYARPTAGTDNPDDVKGASIIPLLTTLILIVICVNVAILIYARTAIRHGEIVVRTALGASRRRVIAQLFAESLVLSLTAALLGLGIAEFALSKANVVLASIYGGQLPFWMDFRLSFGSVVYAAGLAVLAALITGAIPALRATGSQLRHGLQQLSAGGGSMRLGRMWTVLIVGQVAVAVALLPIAVWQTREFVRFGTVEPGIAAEEFASFIVNMEQAAGNHAAIYSERVSELARQIGAEPGVAAATYASALPGKERDVRIEVEPPSDSAGAAPSNEHIRFALVAPDFMDVFGVRPVAGRTFTAADADSSAGAIVVNQTFVRHKLGGGDALGRRIRHVVASNAFENPGDVQVGRWLEIVGVVPDFPNPMMPEQNEAKAYQPARPGAMQPAVLSVRLRDANQAGLEARFRRMAAAIDPALQVRNVRKLDAVYDADQSILVLTALGIGIVTLSVLLLSAAGIYAMMSLAVTRRQREIAIRAALGGNPRHILVSVFKRASVQLGVGVALGLGVILAIARTVIINDESLGRELARNPGFVATVATIIAAVGIFASLGPARRGLRIAPAEALKQE
jgi:putative ABC transport system permease protein